jgi:NAD(P)-dependent dehydrogenase (short-subunit alcohol dehydrogenase family)
MTTQTARIALVTGANRGLGKEVAEQLAKAGLHVIVSGRNAQAIESVAPEIHQQGCHADALELDTSDPTSIQRAAQTVHNQFGRLDVLVNNAGIMKDGSWMGNTSTSISSEILRKTFETNFFGVVALTQTLWPLLEKSGHATVVNVSSIMGSNTIHAQTDGPLAQTKPFAYDASKAALNAFTTHLASVGLEHGIKVNSAHPGWVKTELGSEYAPLSVEEGSRTIVDLALLEVDGITGRFMHNGDVLPW